MLYLCFISLFLLQIVTVRPRLFTSLQWNLGILLLILHHGVYVFEESATEMITSPERLSIQ